MKNKATKASALLLTTILLFVILSMVVSLSYVTVMEQKMSQKTKSSVGAFFNADSGVEWALNKIATGSGTISTVFTMDSNGKVSCPNFTDDTSPCDIYLLDVNGKVITADGPLANVQAVRSVGTQNTGEPTQRAIEAAVASPVCEIVKFAGYTSDSVSGNYGSMAGIGGTYPGIKAMNHRCDQEFSGSRICTSNEVMFLWRASAISPLSSAGYAWVEPAGGIETYDCYSWMVNRGGVKGTMMQWSDTSEGGFSHVLIPSITTTGNCTAVSYPIACCEPCL